MEAIVKHFAGNGAGHRAGGAISRSALSLLKDRPLPAGILPSPRRKAALSLGERVSRSGAFTSRGETGEGSVAGS
jgi:hypothetical protein